MNKLGMFRFKQPHAQKLVELSRSRERAIILRGVQPGLVFREKCKNNPVLGSVVGVKPVQRNMWVMFKTGAFDVECIGAKSIWFRKR